MEWKNQLTKTPYLVLFMVLISVGVGTASALITITLAGNVIITDDLTVDTDTLVVDSSANKVGIGNLSPDAALHVRGAGSDFTPNKQGIQLTGSDASGNVGIEMTGNSKTPYIDFQNDIDNTDFDARIILREDNTLSIEGADLEVTGNYTYATNQNRTLVIPSHAFVPDINSQLDYRDSALTNLQHKTMNGSTAGIYAPVYGIPNEAQINEINCFFGDFDPLIDFYIKCGLAYTNVRSSWSVVGEVDTITNGTTDGFYEKITKEFSPVYYDDSLGYFVDITFQPTGANCADNSCFIMGAEIIYEVSKTD